METAPFLIEDHSSRPFKPQFSSSPTALLKPSEDKEAGGRRRKLNDEEFAASVGRSLRGGTEEPNKTAFEPKEKRRNHDHLRVEAESLRDLSPERPAPIKAKKEDTIVFLPTNLDNLHGRVAAF